jgi:Icc-related predicted phosphoesterase
MKVFYASDLHGSNRCFRKFLNAARFYGVDWLVMGGDAAGKLLVPLVSHGSAWIATFQGANLRAETLEELEQLEEKLADLGAYTIRTDGAMVETLAGDRALVEETLRPLIVERAARWAELANDRLTDRTRCLMGLGNDDYDELEEIFNRGRLTCLSDGLHELDGFWVGSVGWSNVTPWRTNREKTEPDLKVLVDQLAGTPDPARTIFNIHVPPYDSGLDRAPKLSDDLRIELVAGAPDMVPVGSTAVADGIREQQPLLSLHGHIHEGRGVTRWGPTTIVNSGSEYDRGTLLGVIVNVEPGTVKQAQLVAA